MENKKQQEITKISIHRALSELKTIGDRIEKAIMNFEPLGITQADEPVNNIYNPEDFNKNVTSAYQSINDMITRRELLKRKIVESNAKTEVEIGGKKMMVADAIVYKDVTIKTKEHLLNSLKSKYSSLKASLNLTNEKVEANLQKVVEATLGKDAAKVKVSEYEELTKAFRARNIFKMVDPIGIEKEIEKLGKEIDDFKSEVDAKLSESNALTTIEI